ncbi:MAG: phosphate ABC transporter permease PstA [Acidimicrobiales bacterium]
MTLSTPATLSPVAADVVRQRLQGRRFDRAGTLFRCLLVVMISITVMILVVLITTVIADGWSVLSSGLGDFLRSDLSSRVDRAGVAQGLKGTMTIGAIVVMVAFPVGIGAAVYLEEYAPRTLLTRLFDINIRNLAGVPSVVYGILGFSLFVRGLPGLTGGRSVLSAGLTLAILVLPIVIITSAEAIRAVPDSLREAGFGVGATRWEVIRTNVLPYAAPGILTGTVLSLSRAIGEAAPLILVGAVMGFFTGGSGLDVREPFTALPIVIFYWAKQPSTWQANTAAAIVVLLVVVLVLNAGAIFLRNHYEKSR